MSGECTGPRLELRIPISPTSRYVRMVQLLDRSIQRNAGPLMRSARIVLSVSPEQTEVDLDDAFSFAPDRLSWRWVDADLFARQQYDGTGLDRYFVQSDADVVAMLDADLLVTGNLDDVVRSVHAHGATAGFPAHVSPFRNAPGGLSSEAWWRRMFADAGLPCPALEYEHTGWKLMCGQPAHRYSPAYLNYGVVFATRAATEAMGRRLGPLIDLVDGRLANSFFKSQIALTLAIRELDLPLQRLTLRDNFPLHVDPDAIRRLNPDPLGLDADDDVRIFHYLGHGPVNKDHFDSDRTLRDALWQHHLHPTVAHFARAARELLDQAT